MNKYEDFLPEQDPMKNYRIKKVITASGTEKYYPQEKVFGFFWVNIAGHDGWWHSYEAANERLLWSIKKEVVEYLPVYLSNPTKSEPNPPPKSP